MRTMTRRYRVRVLAREPTLLDEPAAELDASRVVRLEKGRLP